MWLGFVLTAGGLFGQIHHEGAVREKQLCGVVINVHNNAKFRAKTEHDNLTATLAYLADPDSKADSKALYKRVKLGLPVVKDRVKVADQNVRAAAVPPICETYQSKES